MRYYIFAFLFLFSFNLQSQGIDFTSEGWKDLLTEAKKEDKIIFLDAYTTWCGPCKYMSKSIFTDEAVAKFYNQNFINAKFDMEKGEGKDIAKTYKIRSYPTLLFINGDGELVHKAIGSRNVDMFIDLGEAALDPNRQLLSLKNKYEKGIKSDEVLKNYAEALYMSNDFGYESVAKEYLKDKDWKDGEVMKFIITYAKPTLESDLFGYVLDHRNEFVNVVGKDSVDMMVNWAMQMDANEQEIDPKNLDEYTSFCLKYMDTEAAKMVARKQYLRSMMYSRDEADQQQFKIDAQLFLASEPNMGGDFYNSVAWEMHLLTSDKDLLAKSNRWVDLSIAEEETFYNTDTKASILQKMGEKAEALKWAKKAIALGTADGQDTSETEALIKRIEAMK